MKYKAHIYVVNVNKIQENTERVSIYGYDLLNQGVSDSAFRMLQIK